MQALTETPLITEVHGAKTWTHRDQTTPTTYLRVQTDTQTGRLDVLLSIDAAKQLVASLEPVLQQKRFQ